MRIGRQVIRTERDSLTALLSRLDRHFEKACRIILKSKGRVVVTGAGKPGFIAQKISATFSSTGTPSLFLHPAEALHGDLGRVTREDVLVVLSNSGQTDEILKLLPAVQKIGARIIAVTGNPKSFLARASDVTLDVSVKKEACSLNLAPSASTTNMLAMGDALALSISEKKGFRKEDFAFFHPGGNLGKRLHLKVADIMRTGKANPLVRESTKVLDVLYAITKARAGAASVVDARGHLRGFFTDGDLRRHIKADPKILNQPVKRFMTQRPVTVYPDRLAVEAMKILQEKGIDELPVIDKRGRAVGHLDVQDLLKAGLL